MLKTHLKLIEIRRESDWRASHSDVIGFASGAIGDLREINLSPVSLPVAVSEVSHVWAVDSGNLYASLVGVIDSGVDIGILQISGAVVAIYSVGDHEDFAAAIERRPFLHQIA